MNTEDLIPLCGRDFAPLTEAEISDLESLYGMRFPLTYRSFLLQYGGCGFAGNAFVITPKGRYDIWEIFGRSGDPGAIGDVVTRFPHLKDLGSVPIATSLGGELFVISLGQNGWILRLEFDQGVARRVAESFAELIDRIAVEPDQITGQPT